MRGGNESLYQSFNNVWEATTKEEKKNQAAAAKESGTKIHKQRLNSNTLKKIANRRERAPQPPPLHKSARERGSAPQPPTHKEVGNTNWNRTVAKMPTAAQQAGPP